MSIRCLHHDSEVKLAWNLETVIARTWPALKSVVISTLCWCSRRALVEATTSLTPPAARSLHACLSRYRQTKGVGLGSWPTRRFQTCLVCLPTVRTPIPALAQSLYTSLPMMSVRWVQDACCLHRHFCSGLCYANDSPVTGLFVAAVWCVDTNA